MAEKRIIITGARQNNLKNLNLEIPKNKITVFTGVSGSGKSSLVFETIGAEAQRQINETQNSFIRHRLQSFGIADVDKIEHLNVPVIINQKRIGGNARSTVGTATDINASLRLLYSRLGKPFVGYSHVFSFNHIDGMCSNCEGLGYVNNIDLGELINIEKSLNEGAINFPTFQPGGYRWLRYVNSGYFDINKKVKDYSKEELELLLHSKEHKPKKPLKDWGKSMTYIGVIPRIENDFLKKDSKESNLRSSQLKKLVLQTDCPSCEGKRLNAKVLSCKILNKNIADCSSMSIDELLQFINSIEDAQFSTILKEIKHKLDNLITIGLQYLTLDRKTNTLSGGESQRIKMVKHLGNSLEDLLYIFDEPSIGLHAKDLDNLSGIIKNINKKGNTVLIVEHDPDLIKIADYIVDMGPDSGVNGGEIVFTGSFKDLTKSSGKTGRYFSIKKTINKSPRVPSDFVAITNANLYNLKNISVEIPLGILTVVTGVAGSGKSTLISKILPSVLNEVKIIDQSPLTGSVKSNLLTYLDLSDNLRHIFGKENNVSQKLFSSNSEGACVNCKGLGIQKIDLAFMDDIEQVCETCNGSGFKPEILSYRFKEKSIVDVLQMTVFEGKLFFNDANITIFDELFDLLKELGLDYLKLGHRLSDFSGGERQRLKLARELKNTDNIIVLDEPSTGLHPTDTDKLVKILNNLVDKGNTLIVIEHNLDIISNGDWIIDIGPGAGKYGGNLVFAGTVEELLNCKVSETARFLRKHIGIED